MQRFSPFVHKLLNSSKFDSTRNYVLCNKVGCLGGAMFYSSSEAKCWNCGALQATLDGLFCSKCKALQKPSKTSNYFAIFDVAQDFNVNQKLLTNKYRQLQTVLHPDKYSNKTQEEQNISSSYSSLVNNAYSTLQEPIKRAQYLLKLHGENIQEDQKAADPEFLMQIMNLNEEVEAAATLEELTKLDEKNRTELIKMQSTLAELFKEKRYQLAKEHVLKMKYYHSIQIRINELLHDKMIFWAFRALRTYAPYITLPFAAVIGYVGYNLENIISDKYTPFNESIKDSRSERLLTDEKLDSASNVESLKYSANVLGKNVSPSLRQ